MATVTTPGVLGIGDLFGAVVAVPAVQTKSHALNLRELVPWWRAEVTGACNGQAFWNIDRGGVISGSVAADSSMVAYTKVHLYYRPLGILIAKTFTDKDGLYSFRGLDRNSNEYVALAYVPPYNALVYDSLYPA